jgi:hypothetical protein
MKPIKRNEVRIFNAALDLASVTERAACLERARTGDESPNNL